MDFICGFLYPFEIIGLFSKYNTNSSIKFEQILGNISFVVLFIAVLLYWFDFADRKPLSKQLKSLCMIGANLSLTLLLLLRWWESGHFPLSNLYESLIGLSWSFTTVHLFVTLNFTKFFGGVEPLGSLEEESDKIGAIIAPTALLTSVFATFFLPPEMLRATALIPALKSNWLTMHVTVMVISYAFLLIGSLLSIAFCAYKLSTKFFTTQDQNFLVGEQLAILTPPGKGILISSLDQRPTSSISKEQAFYNEKNALKSNSNQEQNLWSTNFLYQTSGNIISRDFSDKDISAYKNGSGISQSQSFMELNREVQTQKNQEQDQTHLDIGLWLNTMSYRVLGLGFPLLTIGILSGAVWANEAWGSYWSWDPKETWALITWLVFAIYFHSRYKRSSDISIVPASIASIGFIVIWICYLGVNLLQSGLHSYGWFGIIFSLNI